MTVLHYFALIGTFAAVVFVVVTLHVLSVVGYVEFSGAGQYNTFKEGQYITPGT